MKKSLLAVLISSLFLMTACDDQEKNALTQKVQQAEQQFNQLKADYEKNQQELTAYKAEKAKNTNTFPALNVKIEPFFEKTETIKYELEGEKREGEVSYSVQLAKTGFDWLDKLLLGKTNADELAKSYASDVADLKESGGMGYEYRQIQEYLGQRGNFVFFSEFNYSYTGGAHGIHSTQYLNIDVQKQKIITLEHFFEPTKQNELKQALWTAYEDYTRKTRGVSEEKVETFTDRADFSISQNFYFNHNGVTFVYAPYEIGSYAEGEIELTLNWYEVQKWLKPDYQNLYPQPSIE